MFDALKNMFKKKYNDVTAEEVSRLLSDKDTVVIDVREPYEYKNGHIPKAKNIPLSQLPGRVGEISKERHVVLVCASGSRSARAAGLLGNQGYKVSNMLGGMYSWKGKVS